MKLRFGILERYILGQFFIIFAGCLCAFVSLFVVFDFFDRIRIFIREGSTLGQVALYVLLKIPVIIHLTMPIAVLIATLMSIGKLSQLSEITAMRACGRSVFAITRPLIAAGILLSGVMFVLGETIVPWATYEVEELYHLDIRKKAESGEYSRENIWHRSGNSFYTVAFYDSKNATLQDLSIFEFRPDFQLSRRVMAKSAKWHSPNVGWTMNEITEVLFLGDGSVKFTAFRELPLIIKERPSDFYNLQRKPESLSYFGLRKYAAKLKSEGVPVTEYLVSLASKLSFPFVNVIAILVALPFSLASARSRTLTAGFIAGISLGFGYHVVHAISSALGAGELLPVSLAAWTANILGLCI
ncbi:MAG: LPS export ABC transporter permease LptG, partial [Deltaproteobacteria bacterium]|nr:LPS export ABC transporter permease LptG [Deltaproteobacteria bacterium]